MNFIFTSDVYAFSHTSHSADNIITVLFLKLIFITRLPRTISFGRYTFCHLTNVVNNLRQKKIADTATCRAQSFLRNQSLFIWYKHLLIFMSPEVSFPSSQKLATRPYSEVHVSLPYGNILYPEHPW